MDKQDMIERFVKFLKDYTDDEGNRVYLNKIRDILTVTPKRSITISWEHLNAFDPELAEELTTTPEEVISAAEDAIQIVLQEEFFRKELFKIHARFFELPKTYLVKELGSEHINKLIQVEGIITRITEVKPFVSRAVYLCKDCGHEMVRLQKPFASLIKPNKCENCGSRNVELDVDKSTFLNFQSFRLQDRPESLRGGQMPRFVDVILLDDLVDIALPGDRVIITGVLRVVLEQKDKRPIFRKIIEANYIEQLSKEIEELEITPEDEQKIKELAKRKDVVDVIVESIAPAIYGMKKEKLGIALALFGGRTQQLPDGTRLRGESHILLVGDPGVAKCVEYNTNVLLADGSIEKIGKIVEEAIKRAEENGTLGKVDDGFYAPINLSIFALDTRTLKVTKARANIAWKRKTPGKMFIVKTKTGKEIKVTPTHPFFTFENGEFKTRSAKDLTAEDLIAVPRGFHHFGEEQSLNSDALPSLGNVLREIREVLGLSQFEVGINPSTYLHYERNEERPTREHLMKIVETFERVAISEKIDEAVIRKIELLKLLANSDIFWDGIEDIKVYTPKDEWVYDLQVPEHHNFIANDIFVHNSQLLRYVSNLAPRAIYTSGKSSSAAGLCVAPESIIETNLGSFRIGNLVEKVIPHKVEEYESVDAEKLGLAVKTQNGYQKVLKLWKLKAPEKLVRITTSNGASIIVTPETKLLTPSGWVPAEKLKGEVLTVAGPQSVSVELIQSPYEYVYDLTVENSHSFIANGFIVHNTAAAVRDELTGSWVLEAGVLVLADMGVALIDEIDKMSDRDRSSIHEALEQQTVSISKAGITATLNARTTVIAAANPKYGRFNRMKSLPEQLDLPPTLLSRFDLIFVLLDEPDEKFDSEVAEHILKVRKGGTEEIIPKVPYDLLKKYIAYARKSIHPTLTREAMEEIKRYYIRMRKTIGKGAENEGIKPIPITPRQLEALIRLSEAHARMRLSEVITREDAKVAIELVEYTLRKTAIDEEGNIDVSILEIGKSSRKINKMDRVLNIIKELQDLEDYGAPRDEVIKEASKQGVSKSETEKIIEELKANSMIYEPRSGYYKIL
ncbi:MAG: Cell division control protein [Thermococcus sp. 40_45]|nr:MAG: Cell division control protein [Thermococcus sp. 40_45]